MRRGSRSTYVLILQDALNALGYTTNTLDGIFGQCDGERHSRRASGGSP